ncbi:MAG: Crp/Fnr family transcriptional regulator [Bacteroidales bacterium]
MIHEYLDILTESAVFYGIPTDDIQNLLDGKLCQVKSFSKGSMISQTGTPCEYIRIILDGQVAGEMTDLSGKILKIEDLGPSKMIAPAFLYGRRRTYPVNVIASVNTLLWQMHRDEFSKLLQSDLRLLNNYLDAISNRAQFLSEKIRFLSFPTLRAKLCFFFLQYSAGNSSFRIPLTHQQLSELFGVARPSLTREIRQMNQEGLINSERDMINIPDFSKLRKLLEEK